MILTTYGFWLPNDPRGSWSAYVWAPRLRPFGPAAKVSSRRSFAHDSHDHVLRIEAKQALKRRAVVFSAEQMARVGAGFADAVRDADYCIYACAILLEHVHMVVARHARKIEMIAAHLRGRANLKLIDAGLHPFQNEFNRKCERPSPWTEHPWPVYIDDEAHLRCAVRYVEENPVKAGWPRQQWPFVRPLRWGNAPDQGPGLNGLGQ